MFLELNQTNFYEKIEKDIVVVDFWAPWCGPCRQMNPVIEKFAKNNPNIVVAKLNVDESPDIAGKYNIMSIPTIIVFKDGEPAEQIMGVVTEKVLSDKVKTCM